MQQAIDHHVASKVVNGLGDSVAVGGKFAGAGLGTYAVVRLIMFLLDWGAARWDAHCKRVIDREALADRSIADRLRHLEATVATLYRCIGILAAKVRDADPFDPSLIEVADVLAASLNIVDPHLPDDMTDILGRVK